VVHMQEGSVFLLSTKFEGDGSVRSKVIRGYQNFKIGSCDPGHGHLEVILWFFCSRGPSSMSLQNLKRIALFVQKL